MKELRSQRDDRERPGWSVGVSARRTGGSVRIAFDTLQRLGTDPVPSWRMWAFVNHREIPTELFLKHGLSDDDYRNLGRTLAACLVALLVAKKEPGESDARE